MRRSAGLPLLLLAALLVAPLFAPYSIQPAATVSMTPNQRPSLSHIMGTDAVDRDVFSLVLEATRGSLMIAAGATVLALVVGLTVGLLAAFATGWIDAVLMRATDVMLSIPRFLILLAATSIAAESLTRVYLVLLIGLTGWFDIARLVRAETASLVTRDWVLALRATGVSVVRVAVRHVFPHLVPMLTVVAALSVGHTVVLEAGLMYLGATTGGTSLGALLHDGAGIINTKWWLTLFPGFAIVLIVLACNALGDALRTVFAPEQVHAWPTT